MNPSGRSNAARRDTAGLVIGILGGSFDPVHLGHLRMAERARDQVPCDEIWFLPAGVAPHKPAGPVASAQHRLEMLARALEGRACMRIERLELEAESPSRSIETMRVLSARHPHARWRLVIGEDSWEAMDSWVEPEELLRLAPAVVQPRPGSGRVSPELARRHRPTWLHGDPVGVSSSAIRNALGRGEAPPSLPAAVLDYVRSRGLYRGQRSGGGA